MSGGEDLLLLLLLWLRALRLLLWCCVLRWNLAKKRGWWAPVLLLLLLLLLRRRRSHVRGKNGLAAVLVDLERLTVRRHAGRGRRGLEGAWGRNVATLVGGSIAVWVWIL